MKVTTDGCLFGAWVSEKVRDQKSEIRTALDVGSGTGLLSLMFAQKNPSLTIDAIEMDEEAAQQAQENIGSSPWKNNINLVQADARTFQYPQQYDIIISNPPLL